MKLDGDLLRACALDALREGPTHGYDLATRLETMYGWKIPRPTDRGRMYRLLHDLEKQGAVVSTWTPPVLGPKRRVYEITPLGHAMLKQYTDALQKPYSIYDALMERRRQMETEAEEEKS